MIEILQETIKNADTAVEKKITLNYYPILKAKRGELRALKELNTDIKKSVVPVIELLPGCEENVKSHLVSDWNFLGNKVFIDPYLFLSQSSDLSQFVALLDHLTKNGVNVVPVINIGSNERLLNGLKAVSAKYTEIAIRVTEKYLLPKYFDIAINNVLSTLEVVRNNVNLLIDFGYINAQSANTALLSSYQLLEHIALSNYRSIIVASGSFIKDLSLITPDSVVLNKRYEWEMWNKLFQKDEFSDSISYSDYATRHPIHDDTIQSFAGSSSIRYTGKEHFLILRGHVPGNHPDGMGQYHNKCDILISHPSYDGSGFSWADNQISECAARNRSSGNPETWVTISTVRHIEKITSLIR